MSQKKKSNVILALIISAALAISAIYFWNSEPLEVYAYNMITSQDIIDNDLLLERTISKLDDVSTVRVDESQEPDIDDVYEPAGLDDAKEIITYSPKLEKKEKLPYLVVKKHIVNEGESLWAISKNYEVSVETIIAFNNLKNRQIAVGQKLTIPNMDGIPVKIKKGDTIKSLAEKFKVSASTLIKVNRLAARTALKADDSIFIPGNKPQYLTKLAEQLTQRERRKAAGGITFIWPTAAKLISSYYGWRLHPIFNRQIFHQGLDISGPIGTKIFASEEGRVYFRDYIQGYGKVIILKHNQGYSTVYAHLTNYNVKLGEWVDQGQVIGNMGVTGRVTGPHLHFEVRRWDKHFDPLKVLGRK